MLGQYLEAVRGQILAQYEKEKLISASIYKELGSCPTCAYKRKAGQTKDQWIFLGPSENLGKSIPITPESGEICKYRESQEISLLRAKGC